MSYYLTTFFVSDSQASFNSITAYPLDTFEFYKTQFEISTTFNYIFIFPEVLGNP